MNDSPENRPFATQLLRQEEALDSSQYKAYRMNLENALKTAESREKLAGRIAVVSFAVGVALMFVGGTQAVGSFDPWEKDATPLSVALGVVYVITVIVFPLSVASYYSRFRPKVRNIEGQLRDASMLALQGEVAELRKQIDSLSRRADCE